MPDGFFTELEGMEESERALAILLAGITDLRPFWPLVVPVFIRWMAEQFDTEGEWGGHRWAPLSPAYLAWKMQRYPGKPILQATGDLRDAASRPHRRPFPELLELIIDDSGYKHGGKDPRSVAPFHQFGGGSGEIGGTEGRPPRREIVPDVLPVEAQADLRRLADEYVTDLARRVGLTAT
jgi:hypothetical protein